MANRRDIEAAIWREYSLFGMFPRQVLEWIPDETIGNALRHMAETERLPYEVFDELLLWTETNRREWRECWRKAYE